MHSVLVCAPHQSLVLLENGISDFLFPAGIASNWFADLVLRYLIDHLTWLIAGQVSKLVIHKLL